MYVYQTWVSIIFRLKIYTYMHVHISNKTRKWKRKQFISRRCVKSNMKKLFVELFRSLVWLGYALFFSSLFRLLRFFLVKHPSIPTTCTYSYTSMCISAENTTVCIIRYSVIAKEMVEILVLWPNNGILENPHFA